MHADYILYIARADTQRRKTARYYASHATERRVICEVGLMEAAPRFELGVKDLQSSALPLGYTAVKQRGIF